MTGKIVIIGVLLVLAGVCYLSGSPELTLGYNLLIIGVIGIGCLLIVYVIIRENKTYKQKKQLLEQEKLFERQLERQREEERQIEQMKNRKETFKAWNPEPWKDFTKNIQKVTAKIRGSYNHLRQRWDPESMSLTLFFEERIFTAELDLETYMEFEQNEEFSYSIQGENELYRVLFVYYKDNWYCTKEDIEADDAIVLIQETERRKKEKLRREIARARSRLEGSEQNIQRESIPEETQIFVWNRDHGQCVKCGSNKNLEYDHIIPLSQGGSNTARNIQLLCESCNRSKGSKIGG